MPIMEIGSRANHPATLKRAAPGVRNSAAYGLGTAGSLGGPP